MFAPAANRNGYSMCGLRGTLVSRRSRPGTACRGANGATARAPSTNTRPGEHENARRSCVLTQPRCACNVASATPCSSVRSAAGRSTHPAAASTRGTCASTILPLCCIRNFIESARTTFRSYTVPRQKMVRTFQYPTTFGSSARSASRRTRRICWQAGGQRCLCGVSGMPAAALLHSRLASMQRSGGGAACLGKYAARFVEKYASCECRFGTYQNR